MAENASGTGTSRYMTRNRTKQLSKAEDTTRRALSNISNNVAANTAKNVKKGTKRVIAKRKAKKQQEIKQPVVKLTRSTRAQTLKAKAIANNTRPRTRKRSQNSMDTTEDAVVKKRSKNRMEVEEDLDMKVLDVVDLTDDDRMSIDPVEEPVEDFDINQLVKAIDEMDMKNTFTMGEFAQEIYAQERAEEHRSQPHADYMSNQSEITSRMREKLIDWIIEVHNKFQLEPETLFLSANTLDRFLAIYDVPKSKLQLVGCVALLLASKYEEIYPPVGQDFVYISANAFTKEQLFHMETVVLNKLKFDMTVPSSLHFSRRFLKICGLAEGKDVNTQVRNHVSYILESTLQSYAFLEFPTSLIAHCATYIALRTAYADPKPLEGECANRSPAQTLHLLCQYTGYSKDEMLPCLEAYRTLLLTTPRYAAVRRKFKDSTKWGAVQALDVTVAFDSMVSMDPAFTVPRV